jgi:hypothetical protein
MFGLALGRAPALGRSFLRNTTIKLPKLDPLNVNEMLDTIDGTANKKVRGSLIGALKESIPSFINFTTKQTYTLKEGGGTRISALYTLYCAARRLTEMSGKANPNAASIEKIDRASNGFTKNMPRQREAVYAYAEKVLGTEGIRLFTAAGVEEVRTDINPRALFSATVHASQVLLSSGKGHFTAGEHTGDIFDGWIKLLNSTEYSQAGTVFFSYFYPKKNDNAVINLATSIGLVFRALVYAHQVNPSDRSQYLYSSPLRTIIDGFDGDIDGDESGTPAPSIPRRIGIGRGRGAPEPEAAPPVIPAPTRRSLGTSITGQVCTPEDVAKKDIKRDDNNLPQVVAARKNSAGRILEKAYVEGNTATEKLDAMEAIKAEYGDEVAFFFPCAHSHLVKFQGQKLPAGHVELIKMATGEGDLY